MENKMKLYIFMSAMNGNITKYNIEKHSGNFNTPYFLEVMNNKKIKKKKKKKLKRNNKK